MRKSIMLSKGQTLKDLGIYKLFIFTFFNNNSHNYFQLKIYHIIIVKKYKKFLQIDNNNCLL